MICPKYNCNFRDGYKVCVDCNVTLVKKIDIIEEQKLMAIKPVKVISVGNTIEAELIMNLLRNNEIPC